MQKASARTGERLRVFSRRNPVGAIAAAVGVAAAVGGIVWIAARPLSR